MKGLILAGGTSSRFGSDKALALYEGKSFLEHAVLLLRSVDLKPVIVTRRGADYSFLDCPVIYDQLPEKGPLGGIYTAMTVFKNTPFLILTCDMPALTSEALSGLLGAHESTAQITLYSLTNGSSQPFPAIYEPSLLSTIKQKILRDELSMHSLLGSTPAPKVVEWKEDAGVFCNVNHREDLVRKTS